MKKIVFVISMLFIIIAANIILNNRPINIFSVVIPHHNFVKQERLAFWKEVIADTGIKSSNIEKVIIVGPDHFGNSKTNITYDNTSWTTYDSNLYNFFIRPDYFPNNYILNPKLVKNDHAIANLISEVHANFPNSKFIPFLIGEKINFDNLNYLIRYINSTCAKNCLLIASVDFSHYVNLDTANKQDEKTIKLLETKKIEEKTLNQGNNIEADSPAALYLVQEFARKYNLNWKLYNQTNSARGNTKTTDITSHVFGAFLKND